jgi:hypothetical protein
MHITQATNIVQLSRLLGHHSPSFSLSTYAHLMDNYLGSPIMLPGENNVRVGILGTDETAPDTVPEEWAASLPDDTRQDTPASFPS